MEHHTPELSSDANTAAAAAGESKDVGPSAPTESQAAALGTALNIPLVSLRSRSASATARAAKAATSLSESSLTTLPSMSLPTPRLLGGPPGGQVLTPSTATSTGLTGTGISSSSSSATSSGLADAGISSAAPRRLKTFSVFMLFRLHAEAAKRATVSRDNVRTRLLDDQQLFGSGWPLTRSLAPVSGSVTTVLAAAIAQLPAAATQAAVPPYTSTVMDKAKAAIKIDATITIAEKTLRLSHLTARHWTYYEACHNSSVNKPCRKSHYPSGPSGCVYAFHGGAYTGAINNYPSAGGM